MKAAVWAVAGLMVASCSVGPTSVGLTSEEAAPPYSRDAFGGWASIGGGCDMRDRILARDLTGETFRRGSRCDVTGGTLRDPYTAQTVSGKSSRFDVDHVVSLKTLWVGGAWRWSRADRERAANDPANLRTTLREVNRQKSDGDVGEWTPAIEPCRYQIVGQCSAVHGGGEGPRGRPSTADRALEWGT